MKRNKTNSSKYKSSTPMPRWGAGHQMRTLFHVLSYWSAETNWKLSKTQTAWATADTLASCKNPDQPHTSGTPWYGAVEKKKTKLTWRSILLKYCTCFFM